MEGEFEVSALVTDGVMNGDQLGAVGEGALNLDFMHCLCNTRHDLSSSQKLLAQIHEVCDGMAAVADEFCELAGDQGNGLCVVESQASC